MADCAGDGVVGGELGELELAEIALAEDQLAVRKQELALRQRKLAVLRQRKGGSSAAAAPAADAGGDRGAGGAGGAVGPVARRRRGVGGEEHKTPWTLMILIVLIPLAGLLVAMPLMHFLFNEPMPTGPCQGICALNDTRLDAYTSGCRELAENPQRLFFYVAPATNVMVLVPLIRSAMTVKAYEFVKVRDWRDALYTAPVILSDQAKASWSEDRYKLLYVSQIANQLHTVVPHRRLFMSATFLQNLGPPPNATESRNDTIRHMVFLRHPLLRLRAQYEFDRKYDKDKGKTGGMRCHFPPCLHAAARLRSLRCMPGLVHPGYRSMDAGTRRMCCTAPTQPSSVCPKSAATAAAPQQPALPPPTYTKTSMRIQPSHVCERADKHPNVATLICLMHATRQGHVLHGVCRAASLSS